MCVRPTQTCLLTGMFMPAIRAMAARPRPAENREVYVIVAFFSTFQRPGSALALLVAGVGRADDAHDALAPHDLAVLADLPDRWTNLHLKDPSCRGRAGWPSS